MINGHSPKVELWRHPRQLLQTSSAEENCEGGSNGTKRRHCHQYGTGGKAGRAQFLAPEASEGECFSKALIWQGAVAGGAALGLGALAFYGLGMSSEVGAVDRAVGWPQYVKDRVRNPFASKLFTNMN